MSSVTPQTLTLARQIPAGLPAEADFKLTTGQPIVPSDTTVQDGSVFLKLTTLSADPYMRSGVKTQPVGSPIGGFVTATILYSRNDKYKVGDLVGGHLPFTTYQLVNPAKAPFGLWDLTQYLTADNINLGVGLYGMPGSTAYGGLIDVLAPLANETIFISAASGAVGSLVGLLAKKLYNCTVIGSAGGPAKCKVLMELGYFDHAIDYKTHETAESLTAALKEAAPDGIDMYFENVGGIHFDAAFASLRTKGRIAVCGSISNYNTAPGAQVGNVVNISAMIYTQQRIQGFLCGDYLSGKKLKFFEDIDKLFKAGEIQLPEDTVFTGIEQWPAGFASLFTGKKMGKVVVQV